MENPPKVGKLIEDGDRRRDAIHVAVVSVKAARGLYPGEHVGLEDLETASYEAKPHVGIVDPFLSGTVGRGQWFWLFLYPGTATGLRHVWTHPEFKRLADKAKESW